MKSWAELTTEEKQELTRNEVFFIHGRIDSLMMLLVGVFLFGAWRFSRLPILFLIAAPLVAFGIWRIFKAQKSWKAEITRIRGPKEGIVQGFINKAIDKAYKVKK